MLVRAHDAPNDDDEWRRIVGAAEVGELIAPGVARVLPIVVPTHFVFDEAGNDVLVHFAKPNPVWSAIEESAVVLFCVTTAFSFVPGPWNASPGTDPSWGVPTSYYATAQLRCTATVIDDAAGLADLLGRLMARFQPEGGSHAVEPGDNPFGKLLPAIRGLRLHVDEVHAKFKFGGNKAIDHRLEIADRLGARDGSQDAAARQHLLRRSRSLG